MTCPSCRTNHLALFACADGVYRCSRCRDGVAPIDRIERRLTLLHAGATGQAQQAYAQALAIIREETK